MANEIVALEIIPTEADGVRGRISLALFYPISSPAQVGGTNVVVSPSENLPDIAASVWGVTKKAALDTGDAAFEVTTFSIPDGATTPELVSRVQEIYAAKESAFQVRYTERFRFAGASVDAP